MCLVNKLIYKLAFDWGPKIIENIGIRLNTVIL